MALDYGGLENMRNKENWLEQRELGQKGLFILYEEIQAYKSPKLGQNKKRGWDEWGLSRNSTKTHWDNLPE